jgi:hypothetical protein
MGGTITVKSEYGTGSTFTVRLCQKAVDAETIGAAAAENLQKSRWMMWKLTLTLPKA